MQPRIGISLEDYKKTLHTKIYSSTPGIDFYSNSIPEIYQDCFQEGIFTGKGIYDLEVYQKIMKNKLPENRILSHDLLEGNFLKCGFLSDITLLDSFPKQYLANLERENRWIRGDWQIGNYSNDKNIKNINRFKILDNILRSLLPICNLILLIGSIYFLKVKLFLFSIFCLFFNSILEIINKIIFRKSRTGQNINANKVFEKNINGIRGSLLRNGLDIAFLPTKSFHSISSSIKSIYRLKIKKKLLEWKTAEKIEKEMQNSLEYYCLKMSANIILGIIMFGMLNPVGMILGTLWIFGPYIAWKISQDIDYKTHLSRDKKKYLTSIARETWQYFYDTFKKENNYLVPDNYQLERKEKFVTRTSSTNIGLEILSIISAKDLRLIEKEEAIEMIENLINTIEKLEKWNGHLYNWYNIKTLKPLQPEYISTVDSGNFVGYLYVLKSFIIENNMSNEVLEKVEKIINNTDFKALYSNKNRLFSIGYDKQNNKLNDSYYDFLASEARQTSFIAIAKKDIKYKHWTSLSRTLTSIHGYKGLISWAGTAFEYSMPNLVMSAPRGSLLDESCKFMLESQKMYCKSKNIPWGISESAYSIKDLQGNYQYKAFGIPWLGLKRGLDEEIVISPYSSILMLEYEPKEVVENLRKIEQYKMHSKYGFFDALDFTKERVKKYEPVKTYMAHHQGLILNSINNFLNNRVLEKRFFKNPEIEAVRVLLDEKMPESIVLNKEKRNKTLKGKYENNYSDKEIIYLPKENFRRYNILSNEKYSSIIDCQGISNNRYGDIQINRFKNEIETNKGIRICFKEKKNNKIFDLEKSTVNFTQYKNELIKKEGKLEIKLKNYLVPNEETEIKKIRIKNNNNQPTEIETFLYFEPILSKQKEDEAHPAYNNMFLKFEYIKEKGILLCYRKNEDKTIYIGIKVISENNDVSFEIEKEKFLGRNHTIPKAVQENIELSNKIEETIEPIIAIKVKEKIKKYDKTKIYFATNISESRENVEQNLENLTEEKCENNLKLAKAKSEEEIKFLELNQDQIESSQRLLGHLIDKDIPKQVEKTFMINDIWKLGISGDKPIIEVEIKNTEEIYVIEELLELLEFFNIKNFLIDLVIVNKEKTSYDTLVKDEINKKISSHNLEYLRNNQIFILNKQELTKEDYEIIKAISDVRILAGMGSVKDNLDTIEKIKFEQPEKKVSENISTERISKPNLEFENEYGGFNNDEYFIDVIEGKTPPRCWSNVIANEKIGTVITENQGGYTWLENSRLMRITPWENDAIEDTKTEKITITDLEKNEKWTIADSLKKATYQVIHGLGYTKFKQINKDIFQENTIFIPKKACNKINFLRLKNNGKELKRLLISYEISLVLGENKSENLGKIKADKIDNKIFLENICKLYFKDKIELTSNYEIKNYKINELKIKEGNIVLGNKIKIEIEIELKPDEKKNIVFLYGKNTEKYIDSKSVEKELEEVNKSWKEKINQVKVKTPSKKIDLYMNNWLVYQTITSRLVGKSGFYQSGGATGFRDQLQDSLGMKWIDEKILYNQILESAKHQFIEGDCMHWWHEKIQAGIRTKISDDLLWLPYSVLEYIEFTGNKEILDEKIEYSKGIILENEKEKYGTFTYTEEKERIYEHCLKAINKSLNFGKNGLPKIGTGDWNDGFDKVGEKGEGESIWLGFFLYDILNKWDKLIENRFEKLKEKLKKTLNEIGWDKNWYRRAITDEGKILGSRESEECMIDSISQSWAVISGVADKTKQKKSLESVEKHLVDKENGFIKLLTPSFKGIAVDPGYIKKYPDGVRENGGQYTHGSIWHILALCKIGKKDKALEYIEMINPINHSKTKEDIEKYKIEPYVIPGDIYSNKDMIGRGGWSWYTGSSSWYYKIILEEILEIKRVGDKLYFPKSMPSKWEKYEVSYKYKSNIYNLKIEKKKINETKKIICNGEKLDIDYVILKDENEVKNIEIKM